MLVDAGGPARWHDEGGLRQLEDDWTLGLGPGGGLAAQDRRFDPLAAEVDAPGAALARARARRHRLRRWPGDDQRQVDIDQHHLALGVAVAVAFLVGALESSDQIDRVWVDRAWYRQLESLAGVAQLVGELGLGLSL